MVDGLKDKRGLHTFVVVIQFKIMVEVMEERWSNLRQMFP